MKKLSMLALAATIASVGAFAAPVFAASDVAAQGTGALFCSNGSDGGRSLTDQEQALSNQLQLDSKSLHTIDQWNGCLKVTYTDSTGHTNVALYDPDTLTLVNQLS